MLKIKDVRKTYVIGKKKDKDKQVVHALNGVSLEFRDHEFVSILGPSGCGKTTLLNIIGGLDQYTSGDLVINGVSTKEYKDKDWDTYRNHRCGFIFQNYNLIPHLTVLQNVELALTLSGVSKKERTEKAKEALKSVGLEDKIKNKPNQLSGGQMQRVAIARALVNDPEIILADEPTGALDSKTSLQIMELLKKISKEKLIVMVTHNPELAELYSSRIVYLKDGCVVDDTNPYKKREIKNKTKQSTEEKESTQDVEEKEVKTKKKKRKMSFWTALTLSFKNLITKKARTFLVSVAGSIGIIGIALILAVSSGFQTYINNVQKETLTNYPLTIQSSAVDYTSMLTTMMGGGNKDNNHDGDAIYADTTITDMMKEVTSQLKTNDLKKFYAYLKDNYDKIEPYVNNISYGYNISVDLYNKNNYQISTTSPALYDIVLSFCATYLQVESISKDATNNMPGLLVSYNDTTKKYEIKLNALADVKSQDLALDIVSQYLGETDATEFETKKFLELSETKFAGLISQFAGIPVATFKAYDIGAVNPMMDNVELIKSQYEVIAKSTEYENKDVISNLKKNEAVLVLDKNSELDDYVMYALGFVSKQELMNDITKTMQGGESEIKVDYLDVLNQHNSYKVLVDTDYYQDVNNDKTYVNIKNNPTELDSRLDDIINNSTNSIEVVAVLRAKTDKGCLSSGINYNSDYVADLIDYYNSSIAVTGKLNGEDVEVKEDKLTPLSLDKPSSIEFYFKSFSDKDKVVAFIAEYNENCEEGEKISYNDFIGLIMSSVTTIINGISYVLIAFVSISLVVSSIMIGIITYISVLERIKEIGILRSIGASKKDIKRVFTAESLIIGFSSGALGIIVTLLLCIPINIIIKSLAGISGVASLNPIAGLILVLISMTLTFIAGLIPARIASKKDPVDALRTE
ncbi:MAG: ATP-binding cassette domain-containing protein [Clostridiales bacterium]|nr:ATP-binding cassette domain-containing protein [Clostridiales bacterium]